MAQPPAWACIRWMSFAPVRTSSVSIGRSKSMDSYLLLKLIHILSATVIAGTGTGIAYFMFMANRSRNAQAIAVTAKHVVLGDWIFTAPAVATQLVTGLLLMKKLQ